MSWSWVQGRPPVPLADVGASSRRGRPPAEQLVEIPRCCLEQAAPDPADHVALGCVEILDRGSAVYAGQRQGRKQRRDALLELLRLLPADVPGVRAGQSLCRAEQGIGMPGQQDRLDQEMVEAE